jgi:hypothetical protein
VPHPPPPPPLSSSNLSFSLVIARPDLASRGSVARQGRYAGWRCAIGLDARNVGAMRAIFSLGWRIFIFSSGNERLDFGASSFVAHIEKPMHYAWESRYIYDAMFDIKMCPHSVWNCSVLLA